MNNRVKGSCYEDLAASFFENKGYMILERNYRRKTGEIDLIVKSPEGYIVFTEVKYRKGTGKGYPYEAVNLNKQNRIYRTAEWYLKEKKLYSVKCRFDVISILGNEITHFENAFGGF